MRKIILAAALCAATFAAAAQVPSVSTTTQVRLQSGNNYFIRTIDDVFRARQVTDTVTSFEALRAYSDAAMVVFVHKKGVEGWFKRVTGSWTDDGGITLVGTTKWRRIADDLSRVNVKWFGAVGDSVTNDNTAIQAALAFVKDSSNATLYFPAGKYRYTSTITFYKPVNVAIEGDGMHNTYLFPVNVTGIYVRTDSSSTLYYGDYGAAEARDFQIRNLSLMRVGSNTFSGKIYGLDLRGGFNKKLENVAVRNYFASSGTGVGSVGIRMMQPFGTDATQHTVWDNVFVGSCDTGVVSRLQNTMQWRSVKIDACKRVGLVLSNSLFWDGGLCQANQNCGVYLKNSDPSVLSEVTIQGVHFEGNAYVAPKWGGIYKNDNTDMNDLNIHDCMFSSPGNSHMLRLKRVLHGAIVNNKYSGNSTTDTISLTSVYEMQFGNDDYTRLKLVTSDCYVTWLGGSTSGVASEVGYTIGTAAPGLNYFGAGGGIAIGSTYAASNTAPTDGAIFQGNVGIKNTSPSQPLHVTGNARITGAIYDSNNEPGTSGQVLSTTATGTDWIDAPTTGITGSGTSGQVTTWNGTSTVTGSSNLTYSSSVLIAKNSNASTTNGSSAAQENFRVQNTDATDGNWSNLSSYSQGGSIDAAIGFKHTSHSANEGYISLWTRESSNYSEILKVSRGGSIFQFPITHASTFTQTGTSTINGAMTFNAGFTVNTVKPTINTDFQLGSSSVGSQLKIFNDYSSTSPAGSAAYSNIVLTNRNNTNNNWSAIEWDASGGAIAADVAAQFTDHTNSYADLVFHVRGTGGFAEALRITSAKALQTASTLRIGSVTGTPTGIIGRDGSGDVGTVSLSSELGIASGTLKLAQQGATSGQVLEWNGSAWAPATDDTGGGSSYYQTLRDDGTDKTQRAAVNFVNSTTITTTLTDDGANGETEVSLSIPTDGVTATEIVANAVGNSEMADNAIGNAEMADNAIGNAEMADNAIGNAEMADNAVGSAEIIDGSIGVGDLAQMGASTTQALVWNGSAWAPQYIENDQNISDLSSDQDNWSPTNWATKTTFTIGGDATIRAITGFAALPGGTERTIVNAGSYPIYVPAGHPDSDVGNRVVGPSDYIIAPFGGSIRIVYSNNYSKWYVISNSFNPAAMALSGVTGHYYNVSGGSTVAADWGDLGLATASGGNGQTAPTSALPAGWDINTASSASGVATLYFADGVTNPTEMGSSHIITSCMVYFPTLSDGTQTYTFQFGLIPTPTSTTLNVNNSVGIRYTNGTNSGKWQGFSRDNAGTESTADLGITVAANTNYLLTVCADKARSEMRFYVNGAYAGRVTANMPNAGDIGGRAGIFKSAGTTSRTASIANYTFYTVY